MMRKHTLHIMRPLSLLCFCVIVLFGEDETSIEGSAPEVVKNKAALSGFIQSIGYHGLNDRNDEYTDRFIVRRARLDAKWSADAVFGGRIQMDLMCSTILQDAFIDIKTGPYHSIRIGKFKSPFSLERAQSVPALLFDDFAYTAVIAPNRDIGVALNSSFFKGILGFKAAYTNGTGKGSISNGENMDAGDFVVHLSLSPFAASGIPPASFLLALGASTGPCRGEPFPGLKTPAGTAVFSFSSSMTETSQMYRLSPQFNFIGKRFYMLGEYIVEDHGISDTSGVGMRVRDRAWSISVGYMIAGGKRGAGGVIISEDSELSGGGNGAFELVARMQGFHADPAFFEFSSSALHSIKSVVTLEAGLQWYYGQNSCLRLIYCRSAFVKMPLSGERKPENTLMLSINLFGKILV